MKASLLLFSALLTRTYARSVVSAPSHPDDEEDDDDDLLGGEKKVWWLSVIRWALSSIFFCLFWKLSQGCEHNSSLSLSHYSAHKSFNTQKELIRARDKPDVPKSHLKVPITLNYVQTASCLYDVGWHYDVLIKFSFAINNTTKPDTLIFMTSRNGGFFDWSRDC